MGALKQWAMSQADKMSVGLEEVLPYREPLPSTPANKFFTKQAIPSLLRTGGVILGSSYLIPGEFGRHVMGGIGFEAAFRLARRKWPTGVKPFGAGVLGTIAGSLTYYGFKNIFSGFDDEYNVIEGLHPGSQGLGAYSIQSMTDFGSGWNALRSLVRAGETFESMVASRGFQKALGGATSREILGFGAAGTAQLMEGTFRGQSFRFVRKSGAIFGQEAAAMRSVQGTVGPTVYSASKTSIDMEYFAGKALGEMSAAELQDIPGLTGEVQSAFSQLHKAGFRHGDPHLGNVMLVNTSAGRQVGLIDFGAARRLTAGDKTTDIENILGALEARMVGGTQTITFGSGIIPGADDAYNTIEGLSEKGWAQSLRKKHTEFGSGWRKVGDFAKRIFGGIHKGLKTENYILEQAALSARERLPEWKTAWKKPVAGELVAGQEWRGMWEAMQVQKQTYGAEVTFFAKGGTSPVTHLPMEHTRKAGLMFQATEPGMALKDTMLADTDKAIRELEAIHTPKKELILGKVAGERAYRQLKIGIPKSNSALKKEVDSDRILAAIRQFDENMGEQRRLNIMYEQLSKVAHDPKFRRRHAADFKMLEEAGFKFSAASKSPVSTPKSGSITNNFKLRKTGPGLAVEPHQNLIEDHKKLSRELAKTGDYNMRRSAVDRRIAFEESSRHAVGIGLRQAKKATTGSKTFNNTTTML